MIRNDNLLALGLTLVELCFGRRLMDMCKMEDEDVDELNTRMKTAIRLHYRVYDEWVSYMAMWYEDAHFSRSMYGS